jgi:hypothetical protein
VLGRHAALSIQLDDQDQVRQVLGKRRLDRVMDLGIGVDGPLPSTGVHAASGSPHQGQPVVGG